MTDNNPLYVFLSNYAFTVLAEYGIIGHRHSEKFNFCQSDAFQTVDQNLAVICCVFINFDKISNTAG